MLPRHSITEEGQLPKPYECRSSTQKRFSVACFPSLSLPLSYPSIFSQNLAHQSSLFDQRPEKVVQVGLGFGLLNDGIPRFPSEAELPDLQKLFPTRTHPFLVLCVKTLLEKYMANTYDIGKSY